MTDPPQFKDVRIRVGGIDFDEPEPAPVEEDPDLRSSLIASIEQHDAEQRVYVPQRFFYERGGPICWSEQSDPTDWTPRLTPIDVSFARIRRAFRQRFIRRYRR